ncbi:Acriflavin resistance plasma membrane protein [Olavius algarvensis associated proteobacterium Delta 3]|nr:Acriflavin resistance plasma membrane protein [Olavius algarvensis associated proteobacterium Delta 3]
MKRIVEYTIKQKVFINVVFVILVIAGAFCVFTSPLENMPVVDMGNVFVHTVYYGAAAEDVEQLVTTKIEEALDGLENVEYIKSDSYRNFSSINVKFIDDSDYRTLYDELRFRVLNARDELPSGADEPTFTYVDTNEWLPVIVVNITGDLPRRSLKLYAEELRVRLLNIADVRDATIEGEYTEEFHVSVDLGKLRAFGITFSQVVQAIRSANTKIPTGRYRKGNVEYMLDAGRRLDSQRSVLDIVVRRDGDGNFVRVRDLVTTARMSHRDPTMIPSANGENAIRLRVTKELNGNSVAISDRVKEVARDFEALHRADGVRVVFTNDSIIEINDSLNTLGGNLLLGMTLVIIVLWLTLGFRNALITSVGIPFAFLCAIILMKITGVSLNTISLFAFVLVTGIMVDDAVIIMENIFRHLQMGKAKTTAVIDGTAEVMLPVISSALTTILAFIPMLIMTGSTGDFFSYIPKTVTYALVASLLEALFILPIHVLDWGPKQVPATVADEDESDPFHHLQTGLFAPLWKLYRRLVEWILNHKVITFTGMTILLFSALGILILSVTGIVPLIRVEFFPGNYFRYHVTVLAPVGTAIEQTDRMVRHISKEILALGPAQAESVSGSAGFYEDEDYVRHTGNNFGQLVITLPEKRDQDFPENPGNDPMVHLGFMRNRLQRLVQDTYPDRENRPLVRVFEEQDGPPTGKAVNIRVTAVTLEHALQGSDQLLAYMRREPELDDLIDLTDDRPEFHKTFVYQPKLEKAFEYGLRPGDITGMVAGALNGQYAGEFRSVDEEVDLLVRIARRDDPGNVTGAGLETPYDILDVPIIEDSASPIRLVDLVDLSFQGEPNVRTRYKGKPTITITANIRDGSKLSPARVQVLTSTYFRSTPDFSQWVSLSFGGEFESTSKSYTSLTFAFFIALLGIYLVLASQFRDYLQPVIIISAVPFALIGVVMGLFITRTTFTVGSFLAIVGLTGLVVNDSLLLIDFMNVRRRQGKPMRNAVIEACAARMRPVLITTVTTMLGLLPMAIGIPSRSISWAPMATAFVAGLSSATILTLLITPANYELFENFKDRFQKLGRLAFSWKPFSYNVKDLHQDRKQAE